MPKHMSPLKAIRSRCLMCLETSREVANCQIPGCEIYPWRLGKGGPKGGPRRKRKAIRDYCVWCSGGNTKEPANCQSTSCPLWPFRRDPIRNPETVPTGPAGTRTGSENDS
jgi:hypothetical protein